MENPFKDQVKVDAKIYFEGEAKPYTVKACNEHFAICTKPHFSTVLYSIIDWANNRRGPNNLVFNSYDYKKQSDINRCLNQLTSDKQTYTTGLLEVSKRHGADLAITKVVFN